MYTVAIVDDEVELREGLEFLFPWEKIGFKVARSFASGQDAYKWIKDHPVNVVLTDIRMPFMNGLELVRELKALESEITIYCLLSAHKDFEYAHEGLELGVRHYLFKPTDFDEIEKAFLEIKDELDERHSSFQINEDSSISSHPKISHAYRRMQSSPREMSLQTLAIDLEVNPSYLSRLFKEETGDNFSSVLFKIRMQKASALLLSSRQYTNKEIAAIVGYQDAQNFCRSFKQYFKMTPNRYRRNYQNFKGLK